jgi:hypothetical protein
MTPCKAERMGKEGSTVRTMALDSLPFLLLPLLLRRDGGGCSMRRRKKVEEKQDGDDKKPQNLAGTNHEMRQQNKTKQNQLNMNKNVKNKNNYQLKREYNSIFRNGFFSLLFCLHEPNPRDPYNKKSKFWGDALDSGLGRAKIYG